MVEESLPEGMAELEKVGKEVCNGKRMLWLEDEDEEVVAGSGGSG